MIVPQLLLAAGAEVREVDRPQELAEAAAHTAYLLRVLTRTGTDLGHPAPPGGPGRPGPAPAVAATPRPRRG